MHEIFEIFFLLFAKDCFCLLSTASLTKAVTVVLEKSCQKSNFCYIVFLPLAAVNGAHLFDLRNGT